MGDDTMRDSQRMNTMKTYQPRRELGSSLHFILPQSGPCAHLAQMIHGLVVEPRAHHIKRSHSQHHHHTTDHAGAEGHQPAVRWKHLGNRRK